MIRTASLRQPVWTRRLALSVLAAGGLVTACASFVDPPDRILEVASGRELTRPELLAALRGADLVLLGEQHDNPHHHRRRGDLIAELGPGTVVVAEHLPRGARVGAGSGTRERLEAAGFNAKSWGWPLYEGLFGPVLDAGVPLLGGNAPLALVRQISREGAAAWPAELRQLIETAALGDKAQAALDADLVAGHCGHLPPSRVPAMRAAQRSRDASMALALRESGGRPAVLVAGNGHVGSVHGVAQLLPRLQPTARVVSVGFGEPGWTVDGEPYTYLWITPGVRRSDPCAGFKMPPAPAASAPAGPPALLTSAPRP